MFALHPKKKKEEEEEKRETGSSKGRKEGGVLVGWFSHRGIGVAPGAERKAQKRLRLADGEGSPLLAPGSARPPARLRRRPRVAQQSPQPLRARSMHAPTKSDGLATHFRAPRCAHARSLTPNDGVEDACDAMVVDGGHLHARRSSAPCTREPAPGWPPR